MNSNDEQHQNLRQDRNRQAISDALEDSFAVIDFRYNTLLLFIRSAYKEHNIVTWSWKSYSLLIIFSEEDYPDSLVDSELNRSDDISVHNRISDKHINKNNINDNHSEEQIGPINDKIVETKKDDTTTIGPSEIQINVNERNHILDHTNTNNVNLCNT